MESDSILIGISACVLGENVRFDGGHKKCLFATDELAPHVEYRAICPEVGIGLTVPRPAIRLISNTERIALVETKNSAQDYTDVMLEYSRKMMIQLQNSKLCGYIVCAKSPTCGMERVKIYQDNNVKKDGVGLYTDMLLKRMPWLPVEEDGRLNDPILRENFVTRLFCLHDFYKSLGEQPTAGKLIAFHSRYKLILMAHHPDSYRALGRLVSEIKHHDFNEFMQKYRLGLMQALAHRASRKNNTNVLMHIQGYFKQHLDKKQKEEFTKIIHDYRKGILPLLAPVTLIKHHLSLYPDDYLSQQRYLEPYPQELKLRYGL